ncbi:MAG: glycosyltransferase family 4 protein [Oligoflexales bacterium]|nr:glycosyltransferase family 4 protein [Oligoflexales bacterium]
MNRSPRVDQILPSFGYYDAIGTDTRTIRDLIRAKGLKSDIFAEEGVLPGECRHLSEYTPFATRGNLLIHHFSVGSLVPYYLMGAGATKVTRYHNITPAKFFPYPHTSFAKSKCKQGRDQLPLVRDLSDCFWAASQYNADELEAHSFKNGAVLPLMRDYKKLLEIEPCKKTTEFLQKDKRKTLLFVGRVVPNKAHHDLLFLLKQYYDFVDNDARLICVGRPDPYYGGVLVKSLAAEYGMRTSFDKPYGLHSDFILTGAVNEHELASFYQHADVFVCLSDHEGFCVPLVEAMNFKIPILAHKAAAVPETLGEGGLLVDKNKPLETLQGLTKLLKDQDEIKKYGYLSSKRAKDFDWETLEAKFSSYLDSVLARI